MQDQTNKTILCIEDEVFISELYVRALKKAGFVPTVIVDGVDGLKEAKTGKYDIILLDLMLPQRTGMEILRELKSPNANPAVKSRIIVATNLDLPDDEKAELQKLADGYVIKADVTPMQLVEFIKHIKPVDQE